MFLFLLFAVFVEDTVYVRASFPYPEELKFSFPSFSPEFVLDGALEDLLSESGSVILKEYGNLSSLSIRGIRTQDIDIQLNGIPIKTIQNDYADISLLPSSVAYRGVIIKHPLSSYGTIRAPAGGIFLNLPHIFTAGLSVFSDRKLEAHLSHDFYGENVFVSISQKKAKQMSNDFNRFFCLVSGRSLSMLLAYRNAEITGPLGTLIRGNKTEFLGGYSVMLFGDSHIKVIIKGNVSSLHYKSMSSYTDRHKSFYNNLSLRSDLINLSYISEYVSSTKTKNRLRNTIALLWSSGKSYRDYYMNLSTSLFYVDRYDKVFGAFFYGASKKLSNFVFYANVSMGIHLPSFFDLYWPEDAFARGNPELQPEYITQFESGCKYLKSHSAVYITFFNKKIENMIQWLPVSGKYSPYNVGNRSVKGLETKIGFHDGVLDAGFTGSIEFFRDIIYYPHIEEGFYFKTGNFKVVVSYIGRRQKRPASIKSLPGMELVGISYKKHLFKKAIIELGIRNLLDEPVEWIAGYPQEGRIIYMRVNIKI